jgi:formamidopyrimidine-DNA glycosylase
MPELPEVETLTQQLNQKIANKEIAKVKVLREKNFKGNKNKAIGQKIKKVRRQAKVIIIDLTNQLHLLVHLKMTGQLIYREKLEEEKPYDHKPENNVYDVDRLPNKYTRVIIKFKGNTYLLFNNLRAFGWVKLVKNSQLKKELKNFSGVNPLTKEFTTKYLKKICSQTSRAIKLLLMDQKKIAGIGNIYANEALFCARIHPKQSADQITQQKLEKLHECIIKILKKAIKYKGTTDKDEAFRTAEGERGGMQNYLMIYGKEGEDCPQCNGKIKKIKVSGRGTYFCPNCQKKTEEK